MSLHKCYKTYSRIELHHSQDKWNAHADTFLHNQQKDTYLQTALFNTPNANGSQGRQTPTLTDNPQIQPLPSLHQKRKVWWSRQDSNLHSGDEPP